MLKLYENIKTRRKAINMTQDELAKRVGYKSRSAIAHIEKGKRDIPQSKIVAIAHALDIEPGLLMGHDDTHDYISSIDHTHEDDELHEKLAAMTSDEREGLFMRLFDELSHEEQKEVLVRLVQRQF